MGAPSPGASGWPGPSSCWVPRGQPPCWAQWARRRLAVSLPAKAGGAWAGRVGAGAPRVRTEGQGQAAWLHATPRGGEEPGLGEQDFLASWPHKAPFVEDPAPAQTRVGEQ